MTSIVAAEPAKPAAPKPEAKPNALVTEATRPKAPAPKPKAKPNALVTEATRPEPTRPALAIDTDRVKGIGGQDAAARILRPPVHPDAREWPYGMVITPPDTGDDNVLVPGTNHLPWLPRLPADASEPERLMHDLNRGIAGFVKLLTPQGS